MLNEQKGELGIMVNNILAFPLTEAHHNLNQVNSIQESSH